MEVDPKKQKFEYLIMMDFESTCIKDMRINPQEIIEFPATLVRTADYAVVDRFHSYVKPVYKPQLSPFCIKLTGIKQHDVNTAPVFSEVLTEFRKFLEKHQLSGKKAIFVTCGDWDLETMLPSQCHLSNETLPIFMKSWINIKKEYERITKRYINRSENDLQQMMAHFKVEFTGRLHSGRDDVNNLVNLVIEMCKENELEATVIDPTWGDECLMPALIDERAAQRRCAQESMDTSDAKKSRGPEMDPDIRSKLHNVERESEQVLDYVLIIDFEATCLKDMKIDPQEIIEFPCVVWDVKGRNIVSTFHAYVRPLFRPRLSPFCIKLTHIPQNLVDVSEDFPNVYRKFLNWLDGLEVLKGKNWTFACCGNWDLESMLPAQMQLSNIKEKRESLNTWLDIKRTFVQFTGKSLERGSKLSDLEQMLALLGLVHHGKIHSGIDDVHNMVRLLDMLAKFGTLKQTNTRTGTKN